MDPGDTCYAQGVDGLCMDVRYCRQAIKAMWKDESPVDLCRWRGDIPIICCPVPDEDTYHINITTDPNLMVSLARRRKYVIHTYPDLSECLNV